MSFTQTINWFLSWFLSAFGTVGWASGFRKEGMWPVKNASLAISKVFLGEFRTQ